MKKRCLLLVSLVLITGLVLSGCGEKKPTLNVYNWGDYIDMKVLDLFEEEYGVRVLYDTYATNEDLYVKMKQGGSRFDVVIPSDYMIERMIREDLLMEIDRDNISMLDKVNDRFLNLAYDPDNTYSVPYMWGTLGIIYNSKMIDQAPTSWADLWNEAYKDEIIMLNSQRDTLAVGLKKLGYSMNTTDIGQLEEARDELIKQKPLVYAYLGDEIKDIIVGEEAAIGVVWSGDAMAMMAENPNLKYVMPSEGTNLWFDAMVIPRHSENPQLAEQFISFMTRPEIAAMNAAYIGYSSPIPEAVAMLDKEIQESLVAYPTDEMLENTEVFRELGQLVSDYDRIWTELSSAQ